jgi:hypothetical protein
MAAANFMLMGEVPSELGTIFPPSPLLVPLFVMVGGLAVGYSALLFVGFWAGRLVERKARQA